VTVDGIPEFDKKRLRPLRPCHRPNRDQEKQTAGGWKKSRDPGGAVGIDISRHKLLTLHLVWRIPQCPFLTIVIQPVVNEGARRPTSDKRLRQHDGARRHLPLAIPRRMAWRGIFNLQVNQIFIYRTMLIPTFDVSLSRWG